jgi:hypothetical protein
MVMSRLPHPEHFTGGDHLMKTCERPQRRIASSRSRPSFRLQAPQYQASPMPFSASFPRVSILCGSWGPSDMAESIFAVRNKDPALIEKTIQLYLYAVEMEGDPSEHTDQYCDLYVPPPRDGASEHESR